MKKVISIAILLLFSGVTPALAQEPAANSQAVIAQPQQPQNPATGDSTPALAQEPSAANSQEVIAQPERRQIQSPAKRDSRMLGSQRGHRSYFPGTDVDARPDGPAVSGNSAAAAAHRNSGMASLADGVNPCDVDYGNRLDAWRRQVVALTVQNALFWILIVESVSIFLLCGYVLYLDREKRQRHIIAADIVCQLYNAWAYSDHKARTVIAKHNAWIRQINEEYESSVRESSVRETTRGELPVGPASASVESPATPSVESPATNILDEPPSDHLIIPAELMVSSPRAIQEEPIALGETARGASFPTLDSARYRMSEEPPLEVTPSISAGDALARVNRNAATSVADSEWQREKKRLEDKIRASDEQNRALRKMLNVRNESEVVGQDHPFEQEGRA